AAGDLAAAGAALGQDWPNVEHAAIHDPALAEAYAAVDDTGYGRIAVAEAAITEDAPVLWVVRDGDGPRLALAAPARVGDVVVGVAYVRLPLSRATASLDAVDVPAS